MAAKNTSRAPKPHSDLSNLLLLVLHVGVLLISIWVHPVSFTLADGALPHAYSQPLKLTAIHESKVICRVRMATRSLLGNTQI